MELSIQRNLNTHQSLHYNHKRTEEGKKEKKENESSIACICAGKKKKEKKGKKKLFVKNYLDS